MTYSIIARDPDSQELGIAVQSRYFAAGRLVPWIEAGVGVIAVQAFAPGRYGYEGLRLLRSSEAPELILEALVAEDRRQASAQVAIMDAKGRAAVHTGSQCVAEAGHVIGRNCSAQANMMARSTVWDAMVRAFESGTGDLADRLLAALEAAELEGGDVRGRQAASLIVVSGKPSGTPQLDRMVDLRVDDHPDPVSEIRRLLRYFRAHQRAERAIGKAMENDFAAAAYDLEQCCAEYPDDPEFLCRLALFLIPQGRVQEAVVALQRAYRLHPGSIELLLRFADAGVIPIRRPMLERYVAQLTPA